MITARTYERGPFAATEEEQSALDKIETLIEETSNGSNNCMPKLVSPAGEEIELPDSLLHALRQAIHYLTQGKAVTIVPVSKELTTQEAADILNVSRPYLVKLLEEGVIPFTKTGTHRRIHLRDIMAYKRQRDAARRQGLARLTQMSQDMGLYDEED